MLARLEPLQVFSYFDVVTYAQLKPTLVAIVALQGNIDVVACCTDGICQAHGIQCRLGNPGADVRARNEGGVTEQHHSPNGQLRRGQVVDRLKEGLNSITENLPASIEPAGDENGLVAPNRSITGSSKSGPAARDAVAHCMMRARLFRDAHLTDHTMRSGAFSPT